MRHHVHHLRLREAERSAGQVPAVRLPGPTGLPVLPLPHLRSGGIPAALR